jgi:hypothetical protein
MNLDYPKLTAVLVNAIQQQQLQINSLIAGTTTIASVSNSSDGSTNTPQTGLEMLTAQVNELSIRMDVFASTTATSTLVATSSLEFIASVSSAVRDLVQSAGEWVVQKITATLAIFNRVETQTAAITNGLEITDSVNGDIWCMRIAAGEWSKTKGSCVDADVATSTPPVVDPDDSGDETPDTATSTPEVIVGDEPVATSTPPVVVTPPEEPTATSTPSVGSAPEEPTEPVVEETETVTEEEGNQEGEVIAEVSNDEEGSTPVASKETADPIIP